MRIPSRNTPLPGNNRIPSAGQIVDDEFQGCMSFFISKGRCLQLTFGNRDVSLIILLQ